MAEHTEGPVGSYDFHHPNDAGKVVCQSNGLVLTPTNELKKRSFNLRWAFDFAAAFVEWAEDMLEDHEQIKYLVIQAKACAIAKARGEANAAP